MQDPFNSPEPERTQFFNSAHTRKSDELLLIQFVEDQGFGEPDLVEAAERLKDCIFKGLTDYSVPITQIDA